MTAPRRILSLTTNQLEGLREILELVSTHEDIDHRLCRRATNFLRATEDVPRTDLAVLLTISEARALRKITDHALDDSRIMDVVFDTDTKREAAGRGSCKLREAIKARVEGR
jgi:hypothetical protein